MGRSTLFWSISLSTLGAGIVSVAVAQPEDAPWPQYETNPFMIALDIPGPSDNEDSAGGIIAADLDNDGLLDYLVTCRGHVAAYAHNGSKLWVHQVDLRVGGPSENIGLPGHQGPGVAAADIDEDGASEALYLTNDSVLHVIDGKTGAEKWTAKPPIPEGAKRWEHLAVASFRGQGDRDLLLQATNAEGYRVGRYLAAFALEKLREGDYEPLWSRDDFESCAHNGARLADIDGDGRDEVLGATLVGPDGALLYRIPLRGHVDSVFVRDVDPTVPGLEVVALEEGGRDGNRAFLYNGRGLLWETHYQHWEPQNAAVGRFEANREGLQIWCRSRFDTHQKPFVFDAKGRLIAQYEMTQAAPEGWTIKGVEVIWTIDWTGEEKQLAAAKERHTSGDVAIFDAISGEFIRRFEEQADRLYVADVSGDWREEIVVLSRNRLRIYHNEAPNPRPDRERLWNANHYRRCKQIYNYYSP